MNPQMNDARVANKNLLFDVGVRPNRRLLALLEYDLDQALPWVDSNCLHLALSSLRMVQDVERPQANEEHWHIRISKLEALRFDVIEHGDPLLYLGERQGSLRRSKHVEDRIPDYWRGCHASSYVDEFLEPFTNNWSNEFRTQELCK